MSDGIENNMPPEMSKFDVDDSSSANGVLASELISEQKSDISNDQDLEVVKISKEIKEVKKNSIEEILTQTFKVQIDKNDKVKPASITKVNLKALCSIQDVNTVNSTAVNTISNYVLRSDPSFNCLTEIVFNIYELETIEVRNFIFSLCIEIASGAWINKHRGSVNLFKDILDDSADSDCIRVLDTTLEAMYQKRIKALTLNPVEKNETISSTDNSHSEGQEYTKTILEKQLKNLKLIGLLWLLDEGKSSIQTVVDFLLNLVNNKIISKSTLKDVALYLSGQFLSSDPRFIKVLSLLMEQVAESKELHRRANKFLSEREHHIIQLQHNLEDKQQQIDDLLAKADYYRSEVEKIKLQSENQQLNERAARTHLRDNEEKVRAKAFNLLSEDILEPLQLSLSALQRDNPKTESAIHQIELVLESIERDMSWFKE